ncbi:hypothetical protein BaRGS_00014413 [Batillaria attramentaria]|uniref:Uncharacterized protein n=1 Tax=Batillaria attramentaria TaxID=370345 RepID=A0ABD0L4P3_9CAEN
MHARSSPTGVHVSSEGQGSYLAGPASGVKKKGACKLAGQGKFGQKNIDHVRKAFWPGGLPSLKLVS